MSFKTHNLKSYAARKRLNDEVHQRPPLAISSPAMMSYIAYMANEAEQEVFFDKLVELCQLNNKQVPEKNLPYYIVFFDKCSIKVEFHSEFVSLSVLINNKRSPEFKEVPIYTLPESWFLSLPGECITAVHVAIVDFDERISGPKGMVKYFKNTDFAEIVGSQVSGTEAFWCSDFRIKDDQFSRFIVGNKSLGEQRLGRLVQRTLEVETYRMLALLSLPIIRQTSPIIKKIEEDFFAIAKTFKDVNSLESEKFYLAKLVNLSQQIESVNIRLTPRLSASSAYFEIINKRLDIINEQKYKNFHRIGYFIQRRLIPAMQTFSTIEKRVNDVEVRIQNNVRMLRVKVELALSGQNSDHLRSMNHRAKLQLRLQEMVEGLSIIAISYYSISLLGYMLKSMQKVYPIINKDLVLGMFVPVVVLFIWLLGKRVRRKLHKKAILKK